MKRLLALGLVAVTAVAAAALQTSSAAGSPARSASELSLNSVLETRYQFGDFCAGGAPAPADGLCVRFRGTGLIRGLGSVTVTYDKVVREGSDCPVAQARTAVVAVAGKGTIELAKPGITCGPTAPTGVGPLDFSVTGGSGAYAGATGSLRFNANVYRPDLSCGPCGRGRDWWSGTLSVPGLAFDLVPPALAGTVSKIVRAPRGATGVRVRYAVSARDAVDGEVKASCAPRSGSSFRRGSTAVICSAADSSGNMRHARFTITVR